MKPLSELHGKRATEEQKAKVLNLYKLANDRERTYLLIIAYGSENALDHALEAGFNWDFTDCNIKKIQGNVDEPKGLIYFGHMHIQKNLRDHGLRGIRMPNQP